MQKNFLSTGEPDPATLGVSLPIGERLSAKVGGQEYLFRVMFF